MSLLSGPIRMDGIVWGYADKRVPVEAFWVPEHVTAEYDDGTFEIIEYRYRLGGRFLLSHMSGVDLAQLRALTERVFPLVLRTPLDTDPVWPEMEFLAERTSPIRETGPLYRRDGATGETVYEDEVEFRSMAVVSEIPSALDGGIEWVSSAEIDVDGGAAGPDTWPSVLLSAWGDLIFEEEVHTLQIVQEDGTTAPRDVRFYRVPEPFASLLFRRVGTLTYGLDVTGTVRIGGTPQIN